jgi:hypothetical protein
VSKKKRGAASSALDALLHRLMETR